MLTSQRLKELLDYNEETGVFTWRIERPRMKAGSVAGSLNKKGYVCICVDGKIYKAHRLAFLWKLGAFPSNQVDHRDTVRSNNAWHNLREATNGQNKANCRIHKNNTSGFKGVTIKHGKWIAQIEHSVDGKRQTRTIGYFDTPELAADAYRRASQQTFGEFARAA